MFFALLTVAAEIGTLAIVFAFVVRGGLGARILAEVRPAALPLAWMVALVATAGSLFYSEYAHYVPCALCWYQRIAMYPLSAMLGVATIRRDRTVVRYVLPLTIVGSIISIYHYQLQRFPSEASVACTKVAPCSLTWVWKFHYISIPMMALSAFAFITALVLVSREEVR